MSIRTIVKNTSLRVLPLSAMILLGILLLLQAACVNKKTDDDNVNNESTSESAKELPELPSQELKALKEKNPVKHIVALHNPKIFKKPGSNIMHLEFKLENRTDKRLNLHGTQIEYKLQNTSPPDSLGTFLKVEGKLELDFCIEPSPWKTVKLEIGEKTQKEWKKLLQVGPASALDLGLLADFHQVTALAKSADSSGDAIDTIKEQHTHLKKNSFRVGGLFSNDIEIKEEVPGNSLSNTPYKKVDKKKWYSKIFK